MLLCKSKTLIGILGPTAVGKTALAIELAQRFEQAEILSVDSRQVYRYMDIGTAKPNRAELAQVRHHFIDIKDPGERYSAGDFGHQARRIVETLWDQGIAPILVGGSGLYWQAVLDGFFAAADDPMPVRAAIQSRLEEEGLPALYAALGELDPVAQARIAPRDESRITRALEIAWMRQEKGLPPPTRAAKPFDCIPLLFGLEMDRAKLYARIEARVDRMLTEGLVEEVEGLRQKGYGRPCGALGTLGYAEILDYLEGHSTRMEAAALIKQRTRKYAKRQLTWFRGDRRLRWLDLDRWGSRGVGERIWAQVQAEEEGARAIFSY